MYLGAMYPLQPPDPRLDQWPPRPPFSCWYIAAVFTFSTLASLFYIIA